MEFTLLVATSFMFGRMSFREFWQYAMSGENFGHQNPSVSKSSHLHVVIFQFFFANMRPIQKDTSKWEVVFLKPWTSTSYISNSNASFVTSNEFSTLIGDVVWVGIMFTFTISNFYRLDSQKNSRVNYQIYNETYAKTGLKIRLPLISLWLLEVHVCWFPNWIHKSHLCSLLNVK